MHFAPRAGVLRALGFSCAYSIPQNEGSATCRSFTAKNRIRQYWLPVDYESTDSYILTDCYGTIIQGALRAEPYLFSCSRNDRTDTDPFLNGLDFPQSRGLDNKCLLAAAIQEGFPYVWLIAWHGPEMA